MLSTQKVSSPGCNSRRDVAYGRYMKTLSLLRKNYFNESVSKNVNVTMNTILEFLFNFGHVKFAVPLNFKPILRLRYRRHCYEGLLPSNKINLIQK
jgi:hypothetical protein